MMNIDDVYLFNIASHAIIGYNEDGDKDYGHMRYFEVFFKTCY